MGAYRARDLFNGPSLLSFVRVPLAVLFPFTLGRPALASVILACAGASDVVDGWWARRTNRATAVGAVVDPVTDKIFVITVVVSLVAFGRLTPSSVVWLSTREIGELPLVVWLLVSHSARRARREHARANVLGKLATALQFATVACALWSVRGADVLVFVTALAGAVAAIGYWLVHFAALRGKLAPMPILTKM